MVALTGARTASPLQDAAVAPPQAGRGAVAQQLPAPVGQPDGLFLFGGVVVDAERAPPRPIAGQAAGRRQPTSGCSKSKNAMALGLALSTAPSRGKAFRSPMRPR